MGSGKEKKKKDTKHPNHNNHTTPNMHNQLILNMEINKETLIKLIGNSKGKGGITGP